MDFKSSYGEDEPTAEMLRAADNVLLVSYANFEGRKFTGLSYPTETLNETSRTGVYVISNPPVPLSIAWAGFEYTRTSRTIKMAGPMRCRPLALYWDVEPRP